MESNSPSLHQTQGDSYEKLGEYFDSQLSDRVEHRSLANLFKSRMIVLARQHKSRPEIESTFRDMQSALSPVDRSMTVFSQFEKRNLLWEDFKGEAQAFYEMAMAQSE